MKQLFCVLAVVLLMQNVYAQHVGINNSDPNLSLDITGGFGIRSVIGIPYLNNYNVPINVSFIELQQDGNVTGPVTIIGPDPWIDGRRVVIRNICGYPATFGTTVIKSLETKEFICRNIGGWSVISEKDPSQLEKITEGSNTGWRLLGRDPDYYENIGQDAVDFSKSSNSNLLYGASGIRSFAANSHTIASGLSSAAFNSSSKAFGTSSTSMGFDTKASSFASLSIGQNNDTIAGSNRNIWVETDPVFIIGNGTPTQSSNAMTVYKNGTFDLQNHTSLPSNKTSKFYILNGVPYYGDSMLVTKKYQIGDFAFGGIVFWVDESGQHGLVCAKTDQSAGIRWYAGTYTNTMALADGPLSGDKNTLLCISNQGYGDGSTYAARISNELQVTENNITYGDWYLPSRQELALMYANRAIIGTTSTSHGGSGFDLTVSYWSSTEYDFYNAYMIQFFNNGAEVQNNKDSSNVSVRVVRRF
ncbi:MAG: DUF1566 domain-containing protein [Saprospiraceae bacterium]|nr:DUF1566 domain-containing protein [Saprospiraceae bacterium]MBK8888632.1 DUF1566 domain-containing protein [Saprospiraceae bacterium]